MNVKFFRALLSALLLAAAASPATARPRATALRTEYMTAPLGLDVARPRLMWRIENTGGACTQEAYEVSVASSRRLLESGAADVWRSGRRTSDARTAVYEGPALDSHTRYWWRVEFWADGRKYRSEPAWFETGKMAPEDWTAAWITDGHDREYGPSPRFRTEFALPKKVASARCYVSGLGYYELYVNGERVGGRTLDPGFTDFGKRVLYSVYDVTGLVRRGANAVGVQLGNGWYNEQTPTVWNFHEAPWRDRPRMVCELRVVYEDGTTQTVASGDGWLTATGPWLFDNIHVGATYDARLEQDGWTEPGFDASAWERARATECPAPRMEAMKMPPVAVAAEIEPVSVRRIDDTTYLFDMGVNFAGVCRLRISGPAGARASFSHGEMLTPEGRLDQRNIDMHLRPRNAREKIQTDVYVLRGEGVEEFVPSFTYHGFRYVELTLSEPMPVDRRTLTGMVMHSDVRKIGSFECSDTLLNRMHEICNRSYLSNLFGIPTDCPTREKNGWMADGFMVQEAGMFSFDSRNVYAKWVRDMIDAQEPNGDVPGIVPTSWRWDSDWAGPIWDAAIFIVPSLLYRYTGDVETMRDVYPAAERYLAYIETTEDARGLVAHGLGDWLFYKAETPVDFMATAYVYQDNLMMAEMARLTGRDADREKYLRKAAQLRERINACFFDPETVSYANRTQLSYALPLYMGIVPDRYRERLAENLRRKVADNGYNLDFGFIGSVMVPDVLSDMGHAQTAYRMATRTTMPSWGYWIARTGATSLYETWDVTRHIGDASLNHPSMGAISAWMYKSLAGINLDPSEPAFRKILFRPSFVEGLDWVKASHDSVQGEIRSEWRREGDRVTLKVTVPAASTATVVLPGGRTEHVGGGEHEFTVRLGTERTED